MYDYAGKLIELHDGDTGIFILSIGFHFSATLRLRILGMNSPEVYGPTKEAGDKATEFAKTLLTDKDLIISTHKTDNFGRWLASVIILPDKIDFATAMIEAKMAIPYMIDKMGDVYLIKDNPEMKSFSF